jgi:hypothetical protein
MTKYKIERDPHVDRIIYYFNREEGIILEARVLAEGGEDVESITYEPAATDNNLRCGDTPAFSNRNATTTSPSKEARITKSSNKYCLRQARRKRC